MEYDKIIAELEKQLSLAVDFLIAAHDKASAANEIANLASAIANLKSCIPEATVSEEIPEPVIAETGLPF